MKSFNLSDIKNVLGQTASYHGDLDRSFSNVQSVELIDEHSLDWINPTMYEKEQYLLETVAPVVICENKLFLSDETLNNKLIVQVDNPKLAFAKVVTNLFKDLNKFKIHPTAQIYKGAKIGNNVEIGANTIVFGNVVINNDVTIGANNVIGGDGFGYERDKNNELFKFPHLSGVIIESNVEIGNCTCIDRGALSNTIIGFGTKIDNLVHIAHNVIIGKNCCIIANSMIAGSVRIGDNTWIAPNAAIREHLSIGSDVLIGLGAIVTKSVEDKQVIAGFPATQFKRMISVFKKLMD